MMAKLCLRGLGLGLVAFSPLVAVWARIALRNSGIPEDRSFLFHLREIAAEGWHLARAGCLFE